MATLVQVGKAWLTLSKMYRAATDVTDGVAKAESALMRAWEILRHNQAGPMSAVPALPRPVRLVTGTSIRAGMQMVD